MRRAQCFLLPANSTRRHLHLRDGPALASVVPHTAKVFGRAVVMPNLKPPVRSVADARAYRERILAALPPGSSFEPLMTLYLTGANLSTRATQRARAEAGARADNTRPEDVAAAAKSGFVAACKYYPAGATTNSADGVTDITKVSHPVESSPSSSHQPPPSCQPLWRRWPTSASRCWCTAR